MSQDINEEWKLFMTSKNFDGEETSDDEDEIDIYNLSSKNATYCNPPLQPNTDNAEFHVKHCEDNEPELVVDYSTVPKSTEIYISTKSKIAYLNRPIELKEIFWNIPVIPYATPKNGVIKKQIKFNSATVEELETMQEKLKMETYYEEHVITSINNPSGRVKFKDIRKLSIGISKKDIMSYRCKKKSAFYNCFVMILRIKIGEIFKEFHIKVFNTGKLEIPGIQTDAIYEAVLANILLTIQPHMEGELAYQKTSDTILINSNFNCGYYINREVLFDILKAKYNVECIYDPCSYPGIQCKYYYDKQLGIKLGTQPSSNKKDSNIVQVSFMIFRTGSVLIVGMCDENVLMEIYKFLKDMLQKEYANIAQNVNEEHILNKDKKKKVRRKNITINVDTAVAYN